MNLFIAPHNDDEALFGAFTLMREKPLVLVVTDSYIQPKRGDTGCSAIERRNETIAAMKLAGCAVVFGGIHDDELNPSHLFSLYKSFQNFDKVYVPTVQGGNPQHDLIRLVANDYFKNIAGYTTYTKTELWTEGTLEVVPTPEELELKEKMLWCYQSQIKLPSTKPHFEAVLGRSEWLVP